MTKTQELTRQQKAQAQVKIYLSQLYEMEAEATQRRNRLMRELDEARHDIDKFAHQREELTKRFETLGKAEKGQGQQAQADFDAYIDQLNRENPSLADRANRLLSDASGALNEAWNKVVNTSSAAWRSLSDRVSNISISWGNSNNPS